MSALGFNGYGVWAVYKFEMARAIRTIWQSLVTPVITTSLYFVVFGGAIGSRMTPAICTPASSPVISSTCFVLETTCASKPVISSVS